MKLSAHIRARETGELLFDVDVEFPDGFRKATKIMQAATLVEAERKIIETAITVTWDEEE